MWRFVGVYVVCYADDVLDRGPRYVGRIVAIRRYVCIRRLVCSVWPSPEKNCIPQWRLFRDAVYFDACRSTGYLCQPVMASLFRGLACQS